MSHTTVVVWLRVIEHTQPYYKNREAFACMCSLDKNVTIGPIGILLLTQTIQLCVVMKMYYRYIGIT